MKLSHIFLASCIVLGIAFLCGLGFWQLDRLQWKEAMIARAQDGIKAPPVPLSEIEKMRQAGQDFEYRSTQATGRFLHGQEAHYYATFKSRPGYFVYTPLELTDGSLLLVNRGYVPVERKEPATRADSQVKGQITISGLARSAPTEKPNSFVPNNDLGKNIFYWKSISQMFDGAFDKTDVQTQKFFLDADATPNPGALPIGGVTRISFPNSHMQYAITWFGLALALLGVGGYFLFTRMRPPERDKLEHGAAGGN